MYVCIIMVQKIFSLLDNNDKMLRFKVTRICYSTHFNLLLNRLKVRRELWEDEV